MNKIADIYHRWLDGYIMQNELLPLIKKEIAETIEDFFVTNEFVYIILDTYGRERLRNELKKELIGEDENA